MEQTSQNRVSLIIHFAKSRGYGPIVPVGRSRRSAIHFESHSPVITLIVATNVYVIGVDACLTVKLLKPKEVRAWKGI
jgi:hypothetical protein